jgi:hypothetical protein
MNQDDVPWFWINRDKKKVPCEDNPEMFIIARRRLAATQADIGTDDVRSSATFVSAMVAVLALFSPHSCLVLPHVVLKLPTAAPGCPCSDIRTSVLVPVPF